MFGLVVVTENISRIGELVSVKFEVMSVEHGFRVSLLFADFQEQFIIIESILVASGKFTESNEIFAINSVIGADGR